MILCIKYQWNYCTTVGNTTLSNNNIENKFQHTDKSNRPKWLSVNNISIILLHSYPTEIFTFYSDSDFLMSNSLLLYFMGIAKNSFVYTQNNS